MVRMASGDQRPVHLESTTGASEERPDHHDGVQPDTGEVGFRFECQAGCSACCETEGEVYLTEQDIERIAAHLQLTQADFEEKYVHRTKRTLRLRKPPGRQCLFHRDNRCSIHV